MSTVALKGKRMSNADAPPAPDLAAVLARTRAKIREKKRLTVTFFGDSISDLDRIPGWYGGASCRETHYAQVFRSLVKERFDNTHLMVHYAGICGQNTYEGSRRLFLLQSMKPDLVVVAFGANDLGGRDLSPAQHVNALELIFNGLRSQLGCELAAMAASSGGPNFEKAAEVGPFVQAQAESCRKHGVPFVNTRQELMTRLASGESWDIYYPSHFDGHPTDAGHRLFGEMLFQVVAGV